MLPVSSSSKIPSDSVEIDSQACENCGAVAGGVVEIRPIHEGDVIEATECFLQHLGPEAGEENSLSLSILSHSLGKSVYTLLCSNLTYFTIK